MLARREDRSHVAENYEGYQQYQQTFQCQEGCGHHLRDILSELYFADHKIMEVPDCMSKREGILIPVYTTELNMRSMTIAISYLHEDKCLLWLAHGRVVVVRISKVFLGNHGRNVDGQNKAIA